MKIWFPLPQFVSISSNILEDNLKQKETNKKIPTKFKNPNKQPTTNKKQTQQQQQKTP